MKPIKTAIFGTGFVGRVHLDELRRLESVEIAAIADPNLEAAQRLGEALPSPRLRRITARSCAIRKLMPFTSALPTRCIFPWPGKRSKPAST
jgi:hypothetical protein